MLAYRTNPTMPKKPAPPVDAEMDRAAIASATGHTTKFLIDPGHWDSHPSRSLLRARQVASQMLADPDYAGTGRRPVIFAHLPDGRSVVVPDDYDLPASAAPSVTINSVPMLRPDGQPLAAGDLVAGQVCAMWTALDVFPGLTSGRLTRHHLELLASAQAGVLPTPPDASAPSWDCNVYGGRLARMVAMADAGDIAGLEAVKLPTYDSKFVAMARFRNLAVIALKARAAGRGAP